MKPNSILLTAALFTCTACTGTWQRSGAAGSQLPASSYLVTATLDSSLQSRLAFYDADSRGQDVISTASVGIPNKKLRLELVKANHHGLVCGVGVFHLPSDGAQVTCFSIYSQEVHLDRTFHFVSNSTPTALAVDEEGDVAVGFLNSTVIVFGSHASGNIGPIATFTNVAARAIAMASASQIYVLGNTNTISILNSQWPSEVPTQITPLLDFYANDATLDRYGNLYLLVQRLPANTTAIMAFSQDQLKASSSEHPLPTKLVSGAMTQLDASIAIAVKGNGAIVVMQENTKNRLPLLDFLTFPSACNGACSPSLSFESQESTVLPSMTGLALVDTSDSERTTWR